MEIKHTPGPWILDIGATYIGVHGVTGASVHFDPHPERGRDIAEANARLIAAAPDLLEALEAISALHMDADAMHKQQASSGGFTNSVNLKAAIDIARGAVAKAQGGAA